MKISLEILSYVDENLTLELFNLYALLVTQIYVNNVLIPGLFGNVNRNVRLGSVLCLRLLKTFVMLGLSILLFNFFDVSLTVSFGLVLDEPWLFIFGHSFLEAFFIN